MKVHTIPVGYLETNCIIVSDDNKKTAVIDPGDQFEKIWEYIESEKLEVEYILITHGHFDHIGAVAQMKDKTGAKVVINDGDKDRLDIDPDINAADGLVINCGDLVFTTYTTPGHSPGGVTYQCGEYLFTGDTLFHDDIGRTDIPGASFEVLLQSLRKLRDLPFDDLIIIPGHEEESTLNHERECNPHLK